jgi:hypothetical protein
MLVYIHLFKAATLVDVYCSQHHTPPLYKS